MHGIDLWGVTVENEPMVAVNRNHSFNDLILSATQERDFVKMNLGPTLEKANYTRDNFKLMILDDSSIYLKSWTDTILSDSEAAKYVSGIAYHWYGNHRMSGFPETELEDLHQKYPNFFTLNTEASLGGVNFNGKWDFGEHYAYDIIRVSIHS